MEKLAYFLSGVGGTPLQHLGDVASVLQVFGFIFL